MSRVEKTKKRKHYNSSWTRNEMEKLAIHFIEQGCKTAWAEIVSKYPGDFENHNDPNSVGDKGRKLGLTKECTKEQALNIIERIRNGEFDKSNKPLSKLSQEVKGGNLQNNYIMSNLEEDESDESEDEGQTENNSNLQIDYISEKTTNVHTKLTEPIFKSNLGYLNSPYYFYFGNKIFIFFIKSLNISLKFKFLNENTIRIIATSNQLDEETINDIFDKVVSKHFPDMKKEDYVNSFGSGTETETDLYISEKFVPQNSQADESTLAHVVILEKKIDVPQLEFKNTNFNTKDFMKNLVQNNNNNKIEYKKDLNTNLQPNIENNNIVKN